MARAAERVMRLGGSSPLLVAVAALVVALGAGVRLALPAAGAPNDAELDGLAQMLARGDEDIIAALVAELAHVDPEVVVNSAGAIEEAAKKVEIPAKVLIALGEALSNDFVLAPAVASTAIAEAADTGRAELPSEVIGALGHALTDIDSSVACNAAVAIVRAAVKADIPEEVSARPWRMLTLGSLQTQLRPSVWPPRRLRFRPRCSSRWGRP